MTQRPGTEPTNPSEHARTPRVLITAGPTQEPIDAVRYIGNRSSGRLGVAIADAAAIRGWHVTLLLGPTSVRPSDTRVGVKLFRTVAELQSLLESEFPKADVLIMAAAVADFRPRVPPEQLGQKLKRTAAGLTIELEPTPDLLAACGVRKSPHQVIVGFALELEERLMSSAREKLVRKGADMIVANPLETMDSESISARLLHKDGRVEEPGSAGTRGVAKAAFAEWLLDRVERRPEPRG